MVVRGYSGISKIAVLAVDSLVRALCEVSREALSSYWLIDILPHTPARISINKVVRHCSCVLPRRAENGSKKIALWWVAGDFFVLTAFNSRGIPRPIVSVKKLRRLNAHLAE